MFAANMMSNFKKYNSKNYEWLKKQHGATLSKRMIGNTYGVGNKSRSGMPGVKSCLGKTIPDETRKKISETKKGNPMSDETKQKIRDARAKQIMKPVSLETKQKIREARAKQVMSEETKAKISLALKNKKTGC